MKSLLVALLLLAPVASGAQLHTFRVPRSVAMVDSTAAPTARYVHDEIYERWWREIAACEGLALPPAHAFVRWFYINALFFADSAVALEEEHAGRDVTWLAAGSYLFEMQTFVALPYLYDEEVIKHEMLHWLLMWSGIAVDGHPVPYYGRCGVYAKYSGSPVGPR